MKRILLLMVCLTSVLLSFGCFSEPASVTPANKAEEGAKQVATSFVNSLLTKNKKQFVSLLLQQSLDVYRGFSSGYVGSRGKTFMHSYSASDITEHLTIGVEGQTEIDIPWLFPALLEAEGEALSTRIVGLKEIDLQQSSVTLAYLQQILTDYPEMTDGKPVVLLSLDRSRIVLVEAQIIEETLVGAFAFFEKVDGQFYLKAIWDVR